jgi:Mn-dependent DtxR family transcriptional regulator
MITARDRKYIRSIFQLKGHQRPVGPQELANSMGVTKVCAFQKMRRLEALGMGEYVLRKGLTLNREAVIMVEEEIRRHHLLERFFEKNLNMSTQEACDHSDHMGPFVCDDVMKSISEALGKDLECDCGHCIHDCEDHSGAENCHWLKKGG